MNPMKKIRHRLSQRIHRQLNRQLEPMSSSEYAESAIVFAPHEDDETLACGGTIVRKKQAGAAVKIVFLTDGRASHAHMMDWQKLSAMRQQEAINAAQVLGVAEEDVTFLGFPDNDLVSHESAAIEQVIAILEKEAPQQIFIPYHREPLFIRDHRATYDIVSEAARRTGKSVTIYEYPVWFWCHWPWMKLVWYRTKPLGNLKMALRSVQRGLKLGLNPWTEFTTSSDISQVLAQKQEALACHHSQVNKQLDRSDWAILAEVSDGDFLECFAQPQEIFYRHQL
jgi:LmbE family N-acetylglucosaminyl deacetylase